MSPYNISSRVNSPLLLDRLRILSACIYNSGATVLIAPTDLACDMCSMDTSPLAAAAAASSESK